MTLNEQFNFLNLWRSKKLCSFYYKNLRMCMKTWQYHFLQNKRTCVANNEKTIGTFFKYAFRAADILVFVVFDVVGEASLDGHNPLHLFCDFWQQHSAREARMHGWTEISHNMCGTFPHSYFGHPSIWALCCALSSCGARDCAIEKANFVRPSANLFPFCVAKVSKTRQHWDAGRVKDSTPLLFSLSSAPQVRCLEKVFRSNARHQHQHFSQSRVKKLPINLGHQTSPSH